MEEEQDLSAGGPGARVELPGASRRRHEHGRPGSSGERRGAVAASAVHHQDFHPRGLRARHGVSDALALVQRRNHDGNQHRPSVASGPIRRGDTRRD